MVQVLILNPKKEIMEGRIYEVGGF